MNRIRRKIKIKATMTPTKPLYLASHNPGKLADFKEILSGFDFDVRLPSDLGQEVMWEESGETFAENARIKAKAVRVHTDECVLADDSGIVVPALGGKPGVYSARFAGPEATDQQNNDYLLSLMSTIPDDQRQAYFVCCLCFIDEHGEEHLFKGECHGILTKEPRGTNGFGYDPLFYLPEEDATIAEISSQKKNQISHRSQAVEKFLLAQRST